MSGRDSWMKLKYADVMKEIENGDESAKTKLAWLKLYGCGGTEKNDSAAVALLEERVKKGDGQAMWILGLCCEFGIGTERDMEQAKNLYEESGCEGNEFGVFLSTHERPISKRMEITDGDVLHYLEMIIPIMPWTELVLRDNSLGPEGAARIKELLMNNTTVTELDLDNNDIGNEGSQMICDLLLNNTSLNSVNLAHNNIVDSAGRAESICKLLKLNTSLTRLDLGFNEIGHAGAEKICELLMANSSLTELDLSVAFVGRYGAEILNRSLKVNSTLTRLNLFGDIYMSN